MSAPSPPSVKTDSPGAATVAFDNPVFDKLDKAYFCLSKHTDEPMLAVNLGEEDVLLPFQGIVREFGIEEDSPDWAMLKQVARGLRFVKRLKVGDPLPSEILTGKASWQVNERHRVLAEQRLNIQLVTWLTGEEHLFTDPERLAQLTQDSGIKDQVNQAFDKAAASIDAPNKEDVVDTIKDLAGELAHIEALRDQFSLVRVVEQRIQKLRRLYSGERSTFEIVDGCARLITIAIKEFHEMFDQIDAQTGEIIAVLKNLGAQKEYIHEMRDDLFCRLNAWADIFDAWENVVEARGDMSRELLSETYRFLAPRFMPQDEWELMNQLKAPQTPRSTEMVW